VAGYFIGVFDLIVATGFSAARAAIAIKISANDGTKFKKHFLIIGIPRLNHGDTESTEEKRKKKKTNKH
jgi:hypothetical protein